MQSIDGKEDTEDGNGSAAVRDWRERTAVLLGDGAVARLARARVTIFGLGAVGSYAAEGLARAGTGNFRLVDFDTVRDSNRNRQLFALCSTLGQPKADAAASRLRDINPEVRAEAVNAFAHAETLAALLADGPDLVIDAIDSLNPKTELIAAAAERGIPVFSAMGAATRCDADAVRFGPLFSARGCPLGSKLRKRLRRRGIDGGDLWCVYSEEPRNQEAVRTPEEEAGGYRRGRARNVLGSLSTLTGMFGLRLAHEAILRLAGCREG